jgi:hypothetical protein
MTGSPQHRFPPTTRLTRWNGLCLHPRCDQLRPFQLGTLCMHSALAGWACLHWAEGAVLTRYLAGEERRMKVESGAQTRGAGYGAHLLDEEHRRHAAAALLERLREQLVVGGRRSLEVARGRSHATPRAAAACAFYPVPPGPPHRVPHPPRQQPTPPRHG